MPQAKKSNKNALTKKVEDKIAESSLGVLTKSAPSFLSAISEINSAWKEYKQVQAVEETKRTQILANRDINVTSIKEQAQLIRFALEKQFGERANNFSELFKQLDKGFENGDDKRIDVALNGIVELSKISPLADAVKLVQQQLNDPNVQSIEI